MKREIKFRAWNSSIKEMYLNCGFHPHLLSDLSYEDDHYNENLEGRYIVHNDDCYTLMQFTGLKDKNGKEIYEGDVLTFDYHDHKNVDVERYKKEPVYIVSFNDWGWCGKDVNQERKLFSHAFRFIHCDILGNIYENPELLTTPKTK